MYFNQEKVSRTIDYYQNEYMHTLITCTACNGSGYYDHNGSPECGCCDGTGKCAEPSKRHGLFITEFQTLLGEFMEYHETYKRTAEAFSCFIGNNLHLKQFISDTSDDEKYYKMYCEAVLMSTVATNRSELKEHL